MPGESCAEHILGELHVVEKKWRDNFFYSTPENV